jgi:hypothetical protein
MAGALAVYLAMLARGRDKLANFGTPPTGDYESKLDAHTVTIAMAPQAVSIVFSQEHMGERLPRPWDRQPDQCKSATGADLKKWQFCKIPARSR